MRACLVATMRNEGPFILEWLAYHRLIGFGEIVICTNDCVDASPELLDLLAARGLVTHLRCSPAPDEPAQYHAYVRAQARLEGAWPDWLMVLDADEFLVVHVGDGTVGALIDAVPDATAFLLNWRIFGSAGHDAFADAPVIDRFTRAAPIGHGVNLSYKTLFRLPVAYHCPLLAHGPGYAKDEWLARLRPVDGAGRALPARYARSEGFLQSAPGTVAWTLAQVNHYNTRARADYLAKHHRGGGLGPERWDRDENWRVFDRNEEEDRAIQRHRPALDRALASLQADPAIAAAHRRCVTLYEAHLAELAA